MSNPYACCTRKVLAKPINTSQFYRPKLLVAGSETTKIEVNNSEVNNSNLGSLSYICEQFKISQPIHANHSTKSLLNMLTLLSKSRSSEYRLKRRLNQLQRSDTLGMIESAKIVEDRYLKIQLLQKSLKLVLDQPSIFLKLMQLTSVTKEAIAALPPDHCHIKELFRLLKELLAITTDINNVNAIRWSQDISKFNTVNQLQERFDSVMPMFLKNVQQHCVH
jgi:hypothetical protein